jgi:hypothetical protein
MRFKDILTINQCCKKLNNSDETTMLIKKFFPLIIDIIRHNNDINKYNEILRIEISIAESAITYNNYTIGIFSNNPIIHYNNDKNGNKRIDLSKYQKDKYKRCNLKQINNKIKELVINRSIIFNKLGYSYIKSDIKANNFELWIRNIGMTNFLSWYLSFYNALNIFDCHYNFPIHINYTAGVPREVIKCSNGYMLSSNLLFGPQGMRN